MLSPTIDTQHVRGMEGGKSDRERVRTRETALGTGNHIPQPETSVADPPAASSLPFVCSRVSLQILNRR